MSLFAHPTVRKIALVLVILAFAWTIPAARHAGATICEYGYIDTIYPTATSHVPCGSYDSCTRTYTGCRTPYRTTQITYCCGGF